MPARKKGIMQLAIPTTQPFSFAQTLAFLDRFPPCRGEYLIEDNRLTAAICVGGKAHAFSLVGNGDKLTVELAVDLPATTRDAIVTHASRFVGADDDVADFYERAATDKPFAKLLKLLHGLHHVRFLTFPEIAVYSVMMQRAPITMAAALKRKFLAAFGKPIDVNGHTLLAMPELDELAKLSVEDVAKAIKNRGKAARIVDVIHGVSAIGEKRLREAPYAEARDALLAIPGVGPFSAAAILLRGLGRMDELPWLPAFSELANKLYGRVVDHTSISRRYGTFIGYWSFYLMTGLPRIAKLDA
jgi:DNA-3-methyladenine glycosylase II